MLVADHCAVESKSKYDHLIRDFDLIDDLSLDEVLSFDDSNLKGS